MKFKLRLNEDSDLEYPIKSVEEGLYECTLSNISLTISKIQFIDEYGTVRFLEEIKPMNLTPSMTLSFKFKPKPLTCEAFIVGEDA